MWEETAICRGKMCLVKQPASLRFLTSKFAKRTETRSVGKVIFCSQAPFSQTGTNLKHFKFGSVCLSIRLWVGIQLCRKCITVVFDS